MKPNGMGRKRWTANPFENFISRSQVWLTSLGFSGLLRAAVTSPHYSHFVLPRHELSFLFCCHFGIEGTESFSEMRYLNVSSKNP